MLNSQDGTTLTSRFPINSHHYHLAGRSCSLMMANLRTVVAAGRAELCCWRGPIWKAYSWKSGKRASTRTRLVVGVEHVFHMLNIYIYYIYVNE